MYDHNVQCGSDTEYKGDKKTNEICLNKWANLKVLLPTASKQVHNVPRSIILVSKLQIDNMFGWIFPKTEMWHCLDCNQQPTSFTSQTGPGCRISQ
jgi:hypothetical protein